MREPAGSSATALGVAAGPRSSIHAQAATATFASAAASAVPCTPSHGISTNGASSAPAMAPAVLAA